MKLNSQYLDNLNVGREKVKFIKSVIELDGGNKHLDGIFMRSVGASGMSRV